MNKQETPQYGLQRTEKVTQDYGFGKIHTYYNFYSYPKGGFVIEKYSSEVNGVESKQYSRRGDAVNKMFKDDREVRHYEIN